MPGMACPRGGSKFQVGLWPNNPQKCEGLRMDPPISEPVSMPVMPEARVAAEPPDEPPGIKLRFQGLLVVP